MRVLWITAFTLVLDQLTKAAVLATMYRQQSIPLAGDWLRLTFTENPGMAFGIEFGPKGTVTVLALMAMLLIAAYLWQVRAGYWPYRASLALVLGGALGNIIDRTLYGVLLDYGGLFEGKVVDFIHVSLWRGFIPDAVPLLGGEYFELFPIWNVADMAIVGGVVGVLLFHHTYYARWMQQQQPEPTGAILDAESAADVPTTDGDPEPPDAAEPQGADWPAEEEGVRGREA
jgi:signal peptidase II